MFRETSSSKATANDAATLAHREHNQEERVLTTRSKLAKTILCHRLLREHYMRAWSVVPSQSADLDDHGCREERSGCTSVTYRRRSSSSSSWRVSTCFSRHPTLPRRLLMCLVACAGNSSSSHCVNPQSSASWGNDQN